MTLVVPQKGQKEIGALAPALSSQCQGWNTRSSGKGNKMSRVYEVMFIVRPDVTEEDADKLIAGFSATVTGGGGVIKSVEKMGRRKLAYMVRKFNDGNYVLLTIEANGAVVLELERRLRVTEPVIKFLTVRIDEEEKRLAKVKALRGTRRKVSAEHATPAVAAPAAAPIAAPVAAPVAAEVAEPVQVSA
jgi:small subunit ribosomal protein S6